MFKKAFAVLSLSLAAVVQAETYPSRPITVVVGFPPGTSSDTVARIIGDKLGEVLNQTIIIRNVPGGGGSLAPGQVLRAKPDGYTLLSSATGPFNIFPNLTKEPPYQPTDFEPIGLATVLDFVLVANPETGFKTLNDFVTHAKANPQDLSYSMLGIGSSSHLIMEALLNKLGVKMMAVPYKGSSQAQIDLLSGRVQMTFDTLVATYPLVESGKLNALAVSTGTRSKIAPSIPTVKEQGVEDFDLAAWIGFFAPKGTPTPIVETLHSALNTALSDPEVRKKLDGASATVGTSESPAAFGKYVSDYHQFWGSVIRDANIPLQ